MSSPEKKVYEFIESLIRIGVARLMETLKMDQAKAVEVMRAVAHAVVLEHARQLLYVPVAIEMQLEPRNDAIWAEFHQPGPDGVTACSPARLAQLAIAYGRTERWIYEILRYRREQEAAARQGDLPGFEAP